MPEFQTINPELSHAIVEAVGGLPQALQLVARQIRKAASGETIEQLEAVARRALDDLHGGQPEDLERVIELSDRSLSEQEQFALYSLAVFRPKPNDFPGDAALAAAGTSKTSLDQLTYMGLVERSRARYSVHRSISDYAKKRLESGGLSIIKRTASWNMVRFFCRVHRGTPS
jgi:hypothetical protein